MQQTVKYLSHPQVQVDPSRPIPDWALNQTGKDRVRALAASGALAGIRHVVTSAENKAIQTAAPLAQALGCNLQVREALHENDRSSTGFLPSEEFERVADQFFARPDQSVRGWETASAAQSRIVAAVRECLTSCHQGDVLIVGHGGVGTLLYCHLSGYPISRDHDQGPGGGGNYFEFHGPAGKPHGGWRPMEDMIGQPRN